MKYLVALFLLVNSAYSFSNGTLISEGRLPVFASHDAASQPGYYWGYNYRFGQAGDPDVLAWDNAFMNFADINNQPFSAGNMYVFDSAYSGTADDLSLQNFLAIGRSTDNGWYFGGFDFLLDTNYYLYGDAFIDVPLLGSGVNTASALGFNYAFDKVLYNNAGIDFQGLDSNFYPDPYNLVHTFTAASVYDLSIGNANAEFGTTTVDEPPTWLLLLGSFVIVAFALKGKSKEQKVMESMRKDNQDETITV